MSRSLLIAAVAAAVGFAACVLPLPSQELPETTIQPREAQQPSISDTAPLPARRQSARKPQLTDPPTDEENRPVTDREVDPDDSPPKSETTTMSSRRRNPDLVMATWNALTRHQEIALAEIASRRANSTEIRLFAKLMVEEHSAFLERLQPFTPDATLPAFLKAKAKDARLIDDGQGDEASRSAPDVRDTTSQSEERDFSIVQLERELAVQSLASSKMLLNALSGPEFDLWFLAQQVAIHKCLRDQMIVYQRHVSSNLARVFAQGERAADDHLAKSQRLLRAFTDHAVAADGKGPVSIRAVSRQKKVTHRDAKPKD